MPINEPGSCFGNWSSTDSACKCCMASDSCKSQAHGTINLQQDNDSSSEIKSTENAPENTSGAYLPDSVINELAGTRLSHAEKLMLVAICIRSTGGRCWGSSVDTGVVVGINRRPTASEALARLRALGIIEQPVGYNFWRVKS